MNILAIDVGTSSIKAGVLDAASAQPLADFGRAAYDLHHPSPDAAEIPAEALREAVWSAAHQAVRAFQGPIEGVGLSTLTPGLVLLDQADRPIGPFWIHLDRRSRPVSRRIESEAGAEFLAEIGNRPLPGGLSGLCFARQCDLDPGLPDRVRSYLHINGWLGLLLTGERRFDPAGASFTGLWGTMTTRDWVPRWCEALQVDPAWLPPVVCGTTTLGGLRDEVAQAWGLPAGVPVKLGTADTSSAMLAAGMKRGDMLHSVGTTQVLAAVVETPTPDPRRLTRHLGVGREYVHVTHNPVGGAALDWLHDLCFQDQSPGEFFEKTVPAALGRDTEVVLDPPFLGGDRLEIEARRAAFRELTLASRRDDLLSAVLRQMLAGHHQAFAALGVGDEITGRVFLTGGGADLLRKLVPEYHQADVQMLEEASLRGVARLFMAASD